MSASLAGTVALAVLSVLSALGVPAAAQVGADAARVAQGRSIAFDRLRGNCLACHRMADGELPGNIGPPLLAMAERYPDRSALRARIWDATHMNPNSLMPPFGRHRILTEEEIDRVVDFVLSL